MQIGKAHIVELSNNLGFKIVGDKMIDAPKNPNPRLDYRYRNHYPYNRIENILLVSLGD
ncbi:MAG: hypothetical protein BWY53_00521 [Parcubacteria group bacterium ADurb.Bin326]|nr:MAG: hypothetical protein BWY53_00521 [Parcubacteria group bacterium ADurb.Bin326]